MQKNGQKRDKKSMEKNDRFFFPSNVLEKAFDIFFGKGFMVFLSSPC
jgi:hypothetical protein